MDPGQRTLLQTFANGLATAIERAVLAKESHEARLEVESEKIRSALLSSVSHDIRSPLTAIAGAASALLEHKGDNVALAQTIYEETERLNRHVRNLLDMTRLESGAIKPNLDWNSVEEMVGVALTRTESQLKNHPVTIDVPEQLPLVMADDTLIEQAIVNLLENAGRHTPPDTDVRVWARVEGTTARIAVEDRGPGIPESMNDHLFEKFNQAFPQSDGFGLGLAIVRAILRMHGGDVVAETVPGGGARFVLAFPSGGKPPEAPRG